MAVSRVHHNILLQTRKVAIRCWMFPTTFCAPCRSASVQMVFKNSRYLL